jgi:uncharacterized protein (TIGR03663 family)
MCVAAIGAFLRFDDLAARPFHADEATGARITARRMEAGGAHFDPKHYHGPLLADLAMPLCRSRGEDGWKEMSKATLRLVPAIAGVLLVLLPLAGRRSFGDGPMLLAAALLATSPLLVYYSRMFIHEALLGFFGIAVLFSLVTCPRRGLPGFLAGLMFATKESFAISVIAWSGAAALLAVEWLRRESWRGHPARQHLQSMDGITGTMEAGRMPAPRPSIATLVLSLKPWLAPILWSLAAFFLTSAFFYTDAFRHSQGIIDAVRTYFVYETGDGHDKPFGWYFQLLVVPHKSGGLWWFGTPLVLLALWAFAATFRKTDKPDSSRAAVRFLAYSAAGHFLIYSLIAYKTPWLAFLPWAHVCLLAGFSVKEILKQGVIAKAALTALVGLCLVTQFRQARAANGRLASDERNPFACVPTRGDVEELESWIVRLRAAMPAGSLDSVAVIGGGYWPLPWYLRSFEKTGYWSEPPPDLATFPLILAIPDAADAVKHALATTHVELPRGLRANVPVILHVRNEVWERWMKTEN